MGTVLFFGIEPFSSFSRLNNLQNYRYDWYWRKPKGTGHLNAKKMPLRDTETISVFQSGIHYNPQFSKGIPYKNKTGKNKGSKSSMSECYGDYTNFRNENIGTRYPKTGIDFPAVERGSLHPTQKPVKLLEYLIKTYTMENDSVLDFSMGSGSTIIAAINTNRKFVGIEKDSKYFEIAGNRIKNTLS
jgi:site-specific DNA-methyltransferase (adenine-specific)